MAWIPIKQRLPDDDVSVLIATADGDVTSGYMDCGTWVDHERRRQIWKTVTHWQDYPAPPAKSIDEKR